MKKFDSTNSNGWFNLKPAVQEQQNQLEVIKNLLERQVNNLTALERITAELDEEELKQAQAQSAKSGPKPR